MYHKIREKILNNKISHEQLAGFVKYLLSLNNKRAEAMAISLGVLSMDKDIFMDIYGIYSESDPYNKKFILDRLEETHIYKPDEKNILRLLKENSIDSLFLQALLGVYYLINQRQK